MMRMASPATRINIIKLIILIWGDGCLLIYRDGLILGDGHVIPGITEGRGIGADRME